MVERLALKSTLLETTFVEELLSWVDKGEGDHTARLMADRDRLRGDVEVVWTMRSKVELEPELDRTR